MLRRIGAIVGAIVIVSGAAGCGSEEAPKQEVKPPVNVTLTASDGNSITATWHEVARADVAVVLVPTMGFGPDTWNVTTEKMVARNWSVLQTDLRPGVGAEFVPGEPWVASRADSAAAIVDYTADVTAAVEFVARSIPAGTKIVVVGSDMGGVAGMYTAAMHKSIVGVALISPPGGLSGVMSKGLVSRYGDRPLLMMTELPAEAVLATPRTLDSWLGAGSAMTINLTMPSTPTLLPDKQAAESMLMRWISSTTL